MSEPRDLTAHNSLREWSNAVAAGTVMPAGGAVAAIAAALAAALAAMVGKLTAAREKYAAVHRDAQEAAEKADALRVDLLDLAIDDVRALAAFMDALALPNGSLAEQATRRGARNTALRNAARVQFELLRGTADVAALSRRMMDIGLQSAAGDAATAVFLAAAAARSAYWSIRSNLTGQLNAKGAQSMLEAAGLTLERVEAVELAVLATRTAITPR